jgi:hypothetical protein
MTGKRTFTGATAALLAGALLAASGCEENVNYGYFLVDVAVAQTAPRDFLDRIAVCGVTVVDGDGNTIAEDSLKCPKCSVATHRIGTIDWSTNRKGGTVKFVVTVNDIANDPNKVLGRGESGPLNIMPNGQVRGNVEVKESANWIEIGANGGLCPVR